MSTAQITEKAIANIESDAKVYDSLADLYEATDPVRSEACKEMARIVRGWKSNSDVISRRVRML